MVKSISKIFLSALSLIIVCLVIGCDINVDLLGLFASHELNERLESKDNFIYLKENERNMNAITFPTNGEFSFIVMTDTHVENGDTTDVEKIRNEITKHGALFVVILGDISQNGAENDLIAITDFMRSLPVPCYPVLGNHDVYFNNWSEGWGKYIGSTRYKVSDGENVTLFILDSANAFFGKSQVDWLERELKTAKGMVFVLTHSDLFVLPKIKIQQLYDPVERARVMTLLRDNNDKCKMMLMGHSHERVEKEFGDVKYVSIEDYKSTQVYCLVKVSKTGVSYEFKKL